MKRLGALTISIVIGSLVLSVCSLSAWGQGGNRLPSTKESGQTSGRGQTSVEQITKDHGARLTGCLGVE